jgi:VWFA-related protein
VRVRLRQLVPVLTLAILCITGASAAQQDVLRVNTRLVEVDVVVRAKGEPVTDLTKDDFTILDNGKPQRVELFSVSSVERSKPKADDAPLPAGVVTNKRPSALPTNATVILFDRLNTADNYQREGRQQLLSYLKSSGREDLTAIYVLGDNLQLIQDFTNDADRLVRAGRVTRRDVRQAVAEADFSVMERTDPTEDAIESIARHLGALPGRKSLVWMSAAGIPLSIAPGSSRNGKESQMNHATRLLTAASIAVYPVDVRGLRAPDPPRGRRGFAPDPPPDVLIRLADETGGRAFYFNNDLAGSIRTAIGDAQTSYTLGFYPSEGALDGKFHNLEVRVPRKDVEVRHRTGYFALKDQAPTEKERRAIMTELLTSPLDASQIGLQASLQAVPGSPKAFHLALRIDASDLNLEHRDGRWVGTLDMAIRLESSKQKTVQIRSYPINLPEADFRVALQRGLLLENTVTAERPNDRVRIVVQDPATGFAGSVWLPLF